MSTLKSFLSKYWDEGLIYIIALAACIVSSRWESFKGTDAFTLDLSIGRILFSLLLALLAVCAQEMIRKDDDGTKRAGKKKHLPKRIVFAIIFGLGSPQIVEVGIEMLKNALAAIGAQ